jgi:hypothetical protein
MLNEDMNEDIDLTPPQSYIEQADSWRCYHLSILMIYSAARHSCFNERNRQRARKKRALALTVTIGTTRPAYPLRPLRDAATMRRGLTASRAGLPRITFHDLRHTCASVQNSIDSVSWKVMSLLERSGLPLSSSASCVIVAYACSSRAVSHPRSASLRRPRHSHVHPPQVYSPL